MIVNKLIGNLYYEYQNNRLNKLNDDIEFIKVNNEYKELLKELKLIIPDDKLDLLVNLQDASSNIVEYESKNLYEAGFKDGVNFIIDIKK